jgi:hypothetical protein
MSLFRFLTGKTGTNSSAVAKAHTAASTSSHGAVTGSHGDSHAVHGHDHGHDSHGHDSHAAPWEGVNLYRTPFKGDADTVTQVKRTKGTLDRYVESRVRRIQDLQLFALVNIFTNNN